MNFDKCKLSKYSLQSSACRQALHFRTIRVWFVYLHLVCKRTYLQLDNNSFSYTSRYPSQQQQVLGVICRVYIRFPTKNRGNKTPSTPKKNITSATSPKVGLLGLTTAGGLFPGVFVEGRRLSQAAPMTFLHGFLEYFPPWEPITFVFGVL